jgi:hypothetical protein
LQEDSIQFVDVAVFSDSISFQIDKSALIGSNSLTMKKRRKSSDVSFEGIGRRMRNLSKRKPRKE